MVWLVLGRYKALRPSLLVFLLGTWLPVQRSAAQVFPIEEQLLAAQRYAVGAERAARLSERAAQKIADAVRAERRTVWLERTAEELRARGGREYLAARRGAELARRERTAVVTEARALTRTAVETFDRLLETPAALERAARGVPEELLSLSERVAETAARLRAAAVAARDALLDLQAVHTRLELSRSQLTEARARRYEESLVRKQAALIDSLDRLVQAGEALTLAAEDLERATKVPQLRERLEPSRPPARRWGGGLGFAFNVDIGGKERVETARIVEDAKSGGQVVRVDRAPTNIPRALAEVHYLFPINPSAKLVKGDPHKGTRSDSVRQNEEPVRARFPGDLAVGPFLGVQFGDDFVDAVGAGLMLGWRVDALFPRDQLQLGVGYFADPNTRVLGDGFAANHPPPAGETQVRYKEVTKSGVMVLITYGF